VKLEVLSARFAGNQKLTLFDLRDDLKGCYGNAQPGARCRKPELGYLPSIVEMSVGNQHSGTSFVSKYSEMLVRLEGCDNDECHKRPASFNLKISFVCEDSAECINGMCDPGGRCECDEGHSGPACEYGPNNPPPPPLPPTPPPPPPRPRVCPSNCSGHGECLNGICRCNEGWGGESCSTQLPPCPLGFETASGHVGLPDRSQAATCCEAKPTCNTHMAVWVAAQALGGGCMEGSDKEFFDL